MTLVSNIQDGITVLATATKAMRAMVTGTSTGDLTGLTTTSKTSIISAINELDAAIDALSGGGSAENLDDLLDVTLTGPTTGHLLRHNGTAWVNVLGADHFVTSAALTAAIDGLVDAAPGALDTLNELAAALGDDPNFAASVTAALAGKQPIDDLLTAIAGLTTAANTMPYFTGADAVATTTLTAFARSLLDDADAATARATLSVYSQAQIGDPDTDLAAFATAALA